jgi:hypothetical protein
MNNYPEVPKMPELPVDGQTTTIIVLSVVLAIIILAFIVIMTIMLRCRKFALWVEARYGIGIIIDPQTAEDDDGSIYHDAQNCSNNN